MKHVLVWKPNWLNSSSVASFPYGFISSEPITLRCTVRLGNTSLAASFAINKASGDRALSFRPGFSHPRGWAAFMEDPPSNSYERENYSPHFIFLFLTSRSFGGFFPSMKIERSNGFD